MSPEQRRGRRQRLIWKLSLPYLFILLLTVVASGWVGAHAIRVFYLRHATANLGIRARLILAQLPPDFPLTDPDSLQKFCRVIGTTASARVTIVEKSGRVLADSYADPKQLENHVNHPEVRSALSGREGITFRRSVSVHIDMAYCALPVWRGGEVAGAVRAAIPTTELNSALNALAIRILFGGAAVFLFAVLVTLLLSRYVSRPIVEMATGAERYAQGDFSQQLFVHNTRELATLAETLNRMAAELDEKIRELTAQRNEQQAILRSMREGVIAVDADERILFMNHAAQQLLGVNGERCKARLMQECLRNSELQRVIGDMLESGEEPLTREITFPARQGQVLQVSGSFLRGASGEPLGALVVLNDTTRLRQLESVRRDFVANVSHELRTPITAIKGYAETLLEGALEDRENARAFLERIEKSTDRLIAIMDDLLSLARIEQEQASETERLAPGSLLEIVQSALQSCEIKAVRKSISLKLTGSEDITALINPTLLEQAIINLMDNAINYSQPGQKVEVELVRIGADAAVRVRDYGCGISTEHLPRLFERFYRVDRARSRKLGGTGLGLAIVKHIVQAHNGRVNVESDPGKGSVFTISIPLA